MHTLLLDATAMYRLSPVSLQEQRREYKTLKPVTPLSFERRRLVARAQLDFIQLYATLLSSVFMWITVEAIENRGTREIHAESAFKLKLIARPLWSREIDNLETRVFDFKKKKEERMTRKLDAVVIGIN